MQIRAQRPGPVESGGQSAVGWRGITVGQGWHLASVAGSTSPAIPARPRQPRPGSDPLVAKQPASYGSPGNLRATRGICRRRAGLARNQCRRQRIASPPSPTAATPTRAVTRWLPNSLQVAGHRATYGLLCPVALHSRHMTPPAREEGRPVSGAAPLRLRGSVVHRVQNVAVLGLDRLALHLEAGGQLPLLDGEVTVQDLELLDGLPLVEP